MVEDQVLQLHLATRPLQVLKANSVLLCNQGNHDVPKVHRYMTNLIFKYIFNFLIVKNNAAYL